MADPVEASRVGIVFQSIPDGADITIDAHGDIIPTSPPLIYGSYSPSMSVRVDAFIPRGIGPLDFDERTGGTMRRREHRAQAFAERAARFRRLRAFEAAAERNPIVRAMIGATVDALLDPR